MAITLNQTAKGIDTNWDGTTGATIATSAAVNLPAGVTNVVGVRWDASASGVTCAVTDTAGNIYTDCGVGQLLIASSAGYVQVFTCTNTTANAANTVTATFTGGPPPYRTIHVREYGGCVTANVVDTTASATASSVTSVTSSAFTPGATGEVAVCFGGVDTNANCGFSLGTNYANLVTSKFQGGPNDCGLASEDRLNAPQSSQTATVNSTATLWWGCIVVVLKAAAAAAQQSVIVTRHLPTPTWRVG